MPDPAKLKWLYHETGEASYRASQFMAIEGQCFVLVASQILTEKNLEKNNLSGNPVTKTVGNPRPNTLHSLQYPCFFFFFFSHTPSLSLLFVEF